MDNSLGGFFAFVEFILGLTVFLVIALIVLLIVISQMPESNPLRRILVALSKRVGLMAGLGVGSVPLDLMPPIEVIYDLGSFVGIVYYWYTFLREVKVLPGAFSANPGPLASAPSPRSAPPWPPQEPHRGFAPGPAAAQKPAPNRATTKGDDDIANLYGED